jgi:hypothetical protein
LTNATAGAGAGAAPTMCKLPLSKKAVGAATIVEDKLELVATIIDKRARRATMDAYK